MGELSYRSWPALVQMRVTVWLVAWFGVKSPFAYFAGACLAMV
jgi:hypothetical protein